MKKVFVVFIAILASISAISQEIKYRHDNRPQNVKEDSHSQYQSDRISEVSILKALEMVGVRIFKFPISPVFEKEYKFDVYLNEYVDGDEIKSSEIFPPYLRGNTYTYSVKDTIEQEDGWYFDYIPDLTIFSKKDNDTVVLKVEHLGLAIGGIKLSEKKVRDRQFYNWRSYSKTDWILNEEVPLLVYASSYHDGEVERFCGEVDLSKDEEATKELLEKSPHYYVISIKISH